MKVTFIYSLCDPDTLEIRYIGKSNNPQKRYYYHLIDKMSTHKVHWIQSLLTIGKVPILQILEECDESVWAETERKWIAYYRELGYNLTNGTNGGEGTFHPTDGTRKKMSKWQIGKIVSEETRRKISEANKGKAMRKHTEEELIKMSLTHKGKKKTLEHRINLSIAAKKRWGTELGRKQLSEKMKGKHHSEETKQKMRDAHRKREIHDS